MNVLARIKRLVVCRRVLFTEEAEIKMMDTEERGN
jgi:hypothetical protein